MTPPTAPVLHPTDTPAASPPAKNGLGPDLRKDASHEAPGRGATNLPRSRRGRLPFRLLVLLGGLLAAGSAGAGFYLYGTGSAAAREDLVLHKVQRERLQLTIVERGQLEAAHNEDIICRVKAGGRGSTVATTIKWVIDDGSQVKKGDLLVVLDDSGLQEQLKTQDIALRQAEAAKVKAEQDYEITDAQNRSDIQTAETAVEIAQLDLDKYIQGEYQAKLKDVVSRKLIARSDLEMWKDRVNWSERMVRGKYISDAQLSADRARLRSAEIALEKIVEDERVLSEFEFKREQKFKDNDLRDKKVKLVQTKAQAKSKLVQAEAERAAKTKILEQEQAKFDDFKEQIAECKIHAPQDGLVVYFIPESMRFGGGSRQSTIAQGEPVVEGQKMMRIPTLSQMQVNVKVHEAVVSRVRPGQRAKIKVDAFPERDFSGTVKTVATVAAQQDWSSSDVKVYQTMVALNEEVESLGLKPGMSAATTIYTDSRVEEALTIPVQAVLGSIDMGRKRKVYVKTAKGHEEREIVVGITNEKMVEVKEGLQEGDEVVLNPRTLLSEKERKVLGGSAKDNGPPGGWPKGGEGGGMPPGGFPGKDGMKGGGEGGFPGKEGGKGGKGAWPGKDGTKGGKGGGEGKPGGFSKGKGGPPAGEGGKAAGAAQ